MHHAVEWGAQGWWALERVTCTGVERKKQAWPGKGHESTDTVPHGQHTHATEHRRACAMPCNDNAVTDNENGGVVIHVGGSE
jgi:hypothetical protein